MLCKVPALTTVGLDALCTSRALSSKLQLGFIFPVLHIMLLPISRFLGVCEGLKIRVLQGRFDDVR